MSTPNSELPASASAIAGAGRGGAGRGGAHLVGARPVGTRRIGGALLGALLLGVVLVGCSQQPSPEPDPTGTTASTPKPSATVEPDPVFDPEGSAKDNLAYFDFVNNALLATNSTPDGRLHVDTLVAAGFNKADMDVTPDKTAAGFDADSIFFAVRIGNECLVGQSGIVGYHSAVSPVLATGRCLVGQTRLINW